MPRRIGIAAFLLAIAGSGLVGCSDGDGGGLVESAPDVGVNLPDDLPAGQQAAFADGVITIDEYHQAVRAFVACGNGDVVLQSPNPSSVFMLYGTKDDIGTPGHETDTVAGRCYRDTVSWIELAFSGTSEAAADEGERDTREFFQTEARPCLEKHGVEIPEPLEFDDFEELWEKLMQFQRAGMCADDNLVFDGEPAAPATSEPADSAVD